MTSERFCHADSSIKLREDNSGSSHGVTIGRRTLNWIMDLRMCRLGSVGCWFESQKRRWWWQAGHPSISLLGTHKVSFLIREANSMTQHRETGLTNSMTQHRETGLTNSMTQHRETGSTNSMTQHRETGSTKCRVSRHLIMKPSTPVCENHNVMRPILMVFT